MAGKIKGVRFNSDTGKIYTQDDDGNEIEVDDGYSNLEKFGRSDLTGKAGAFVNGAISPLDGGTQYYKDTEPFANTLGQLAGTVGMGAGLVGGLTKAGGQMAANAAKATNAASRAAAKRALLITPAETKAGWRLLGEGDDAAKYLANRAGTTLRDFKPINENIIRKAVGHETARKIERLGLTGARELTENEIIKLHELVKAKTFDQLDQPLINRAKILLKID